MAEVVGGASAAVATDDVVDGANSLFTTTSLLVEGLWMTLSVWHNIIFLIKKCRGLGSSFDINTYASILRAF